MTQMNKQTKEKCSVTLYKYLVILCGRSQSSMSRLLYLWILWISLKIPQKVKLIIKINPDTVALHSRGMIASG